MQKDVATEIIKGYVTHITNESRTVMIKSKELEPLKWEDADIRKMIPSPWFPGGIVKPENYQGPRMDYGDHFNGE